MWEYITNHSTEIITLVVAVCGSITAVASMIKVFKSTEASNARYNELAQGVKVTKDSIVEAFQNTRFPSEWKIDVSKKIDDKLNEWATKIARNDELKTRLIIYMAKILNNSSAYNKLSEDEKDELNKLITVVSEVNIE